MEALLHMSGPLLLISPLLVIATTERIVIFSGYAKNLVRMSGPLLLISPLLVIPTTESVCLSRINLAALA